MEAGVVLKALGIARQECLGMRYEGSDRFWEALGDGAGRVEAVRAGLSSAFLSAVSEHLPDAALVADRFHVVKLMNSRLDEVRRMLWNVEVGRRGRKAVKGQRWLLLHNGVDLYDKAFKTRLDNALALNHLLAVAYYLKEAMGEIWKSLLRTTYGT